jgi:predicted nuclease with RNAse H fold
VRTLGVDLASKAESTAICLIEWGRAAATVEDVMLGVDDDEILRAHGSADATGIDSPFGWPDPFRSLLAGQDPPLAWTTGVRDELRFRRTDHRVRQEIGRWPLSVSSDLIAVPAMRCHLLLRRMGVESRGGEGCVFEVYPAGSLAMWGFTSRGYKRSGGTSGLGKLLGDVRARLPWLSIGRPADEALLRGSHDAFDAFVASLTARAAFLGLTLTPSPEQTEIARREGWIALPRRGSLDLLRPH